MSEKLNLETLPYGHPLRTRLLAEVGAELRNLRSKEWRDASRLQIGSRCCFNDLAPDVWWACNEWRAEWPMKKPA